MNTECWNCGIQYHEGTNRVCPDCGEVKDMRAIERMLKRDTMRDVIYRKYDSMYELRTRTESMVFSVRDRNNRDSIEKYYLAKLRETGKSNEQNMYADSDGNLYDNQHQNRFSVTITEITEEELAKLL